MNVEGPVRFKGNVQVVINEGIIFGGELIILCLLTSSLCPQAACYLIGCGTFVGPHFPLPWSQRWSRIPAGFQSWWCPGATFPGWSKEHIKDKNDRYIMHPKHIFLTNLEPKHSINLLSILQIRRVGKETFLSFCFYLGLSSISQLKLPATIMLCNVCQGFIQSSITPPHWTSPLPS